MGTKIFVGNLLFKVADEDLENLFKTYGEISSAKVIVDKRTGRSKGFGFVEMQSDEGANSAIEGLNGTEVDGRQINVSAARDQRERGSNNNSKSWFPDDSTDRKFSSKNYL